MRAPYRVLPLLVAGVLLISPRPAPATAILSSGPYSPAPPDLTSGSLANAWIASGRNPAAVPAVGSSAPTAGGTSSFGGISPDLNLNLGLPSGGTAGSLYPTAYTSTPLYEPAGLAPTASATNTATNSRGRSLPGMQMMVIPDPSTIALLGVGFFAFLVRGRQRTA